MLTELFAAIGAIAAICTAYGVLRGNILKMKGDMPAFIVEQISHAGGDWYCLHFRIYHGNIYIHFKNIFSNALALGKAAHYERYYQSPFKLADFTAEDENPAAPCDLALVPNHACATSEIRVLFKPHKSQRTLNVSFRTSGRFFAAKQTITVDISRYTT